MQKTLINPRFIGEAASVASTVSCLPALHTDSRSGDASALSGGVAR